MIDPKKIRNSLDEVINLLSKRGYSFNKKKWLKLESLRSENQKTIEDLQASLNILSKEIGNLKQKKEDTSQKEKEATEISASIKKGNKILEKVVEDLNDLLLDIPNLPDHDVPEGQNEKDNKEIRKWGKIPLFDFTPKDHLELTESLSQIDLESSSRISGTRFMVLNKELAKLHRALIQFMLDLHTVSHGYQEVYVPYIVSGQSLMGTGQLPKFGDDLFKIEGEKDLYLIPTAEVPVTNLLQNRIIESKELPLKWVSHTPCFRSESGSYGKDTRGIMRLHQFEKVELVQAVEPPDSESALEEITSNAEEVLKQLEIPYRVVTLSAGDLGFAASKTYDIEAWIPSEKKYREISSCSNFRAFQARRMKARWRKSSSEKPELLHTLNGSGLAIGRTLIALLENKQNREGNIKIPKVLQDYFQNDHIQLNGI